MSTAWPDPVVRLTVRDGCEIDPRVILGWRTGQRIADATLHIEPGARSRVGTGVDGSSTMGATLETGHNVIVRKQALIGDGLCIWNSSAMGEGVLIGAGSVVTRDLPAGALAYGRPARVVRAVDDLRCQFGCVEHPYVDGVDVKRQTVQRHR